MALLPAVSVPQRLVVGILGGRNVVCRRSVGSITKGTAVKPQERNYKTRSLGIFLFHTPHGSAGYEVVEAYL